MSDYTPTTEEVQSYYVAGRAQIRRQITGVRAQDITPFSHEFDRWLAAHDAAKRAEWEAEQGETEWEGIVLGREVGGSGDWSVTVWRPDEIEEARAMFPGSEYVLGRAKWMPVPDTASNERRAEHDLDRMGICTRCGHGITARELLDGDEQCTATNERGEKP